MNLEVIGAGFGPCYHMREVFEHPEHIELWGAAMQGKPVDWEQIFGNYRATVDWPGCTFYNELLERNPDAKVILTVRDPQRWYESAYNTIYRISGAFYSPIFYLAGLVMPRARQVKRARQFIAELVWERDFDERFERHNEEVRQRVPPEKLLVYEVKEGWGPLCDFLGVEVPERPFPHLNDTEAFRGWVRRIRLLTTVALTIGVLLTGLVVLHFSRRRRH